MDTQDRDLIVARLIELARRCVEAGDDPWHQSADALRAAARDAQAAGLSVADILAATNYDAP